LKVSEKLRERNSFNRGGRWTIDVEDSEFRCRYFKSNSRSFKGLKNWNRNGENIAGVANKKSSTSTYVFIFGAWRDRTRKTEQRKPVGLESRSSAEVVEGEIQVSVRSNRSFSNT
jgi:hypothetical protein